MTEQDKQQCIAEALNLRVVQLKGRLRAMDSCDYASSEQRRETENKLNAALFVLRQFR